jgi:hypothetical protein
VHVVRDPGLFFAMEEVLVSVARAHFGAEVIDTSPLSEGAVIEAILGVAVERQ